MMYRLNNSPGARLTMASVDTGAFLDTNTAICIPTVSLRRWKIGLEEKR